MNWSKENPFPYAIKGIPNESYVTKMLQSFAAVNYIDTRGYKFNSNHHWYVIRYFSNSECFYMVDSIDTYQEVDWKEFIARYYNNGELPWWYNLKKGDTVVVRQLDSGESFDYPYGINIDMCEYSGKSFIIENVMPWHDGSHLLGKSHFNGDINAIFLKGASDWTFHSSMFISPDEMNVKKLTLSKISIDILWN